MLSAYLNHCFQKPSWFQLQAAKSFFMDANSRATYSQFWFITASTFKFNAHLFAYGCWASYILCRICFWAENLDLGSQPKTEFFHHNFKKIGFQLKRCFSLKRGRWSVRSRTGDDSSRIAINRFALKCKWIHQIEAQSRQMTDPLMGAAQSDLQWYEIDAFDASAFPWAWERVSERANELAQQSMREKRAERTKRTKRTEWTSGRMSERTREPVSQVLNILYNAQLFDIRSTHSW